MEIAEILNIVFGGTTLCGVIAAIVYRRQNKRIKESEAKQAESTATFVACYGTTRYGEQMTDVPIVYIEMLQFWRRFEQEN